MTFNEIEPKERKTKIILSSRSHVNKSNYEVILNDPIKRIVRAQICGYDIPWPSYNVDLSNNTLDYVFADDVDFKTNKYESSIILPPGDYNTSELVQMLSNNLPVPMNVTYDDISLKILFTYKNVNVNTTPRIFGIKNTGKINKRFGFSTTNIEVLAVKNLSFSMGAQTLTFTTNLPLSLNLLLDTCIIICGLNIPNKYYIVQSVSVENKSITLDRPLDNDVVDGCIVLGISSSYACNLLETCNHMFMNISQFADHDATNIINGIEPFAIIYKEKCTPQTQSIYEKTFQKRPLHVLPKLTVEFTNGDGSLVDFQDKDHVIEIVITYLE